MNYYKLLRLIFFHLSELPLLDIFSNFHGKKSFQMTPGHNTKELIIYIFGCLNNIFFFGVLMTSWGGAVSGQKT
jgi:hypothetical protein